MKQFKWPVVIVTGMWFAVMSTTSWGYNYHHKAVTSFDHFMTAVTAVAILLLYVIIFMAVCWGLACLLTPKKKKHRSHRKT